MKRAFEYRFYPAPAQEWELLRTFGCVRLVCTRALDARTDAGCQRRERVDHVQMSALLTGWKKSGEYAFLDEVPSVPLRQCLRHLQGAFASFWEKRAKYPRFKSREHGKASAEDTRSAFRWRDGRLTLAKMSEPLDVRWSRPLPEGAEPSTVTVSRDSAGRRHVSILMETTVEHLPTASTAVGVEAGITTLLTLSTGEKIANPKYGDRDRRRLAKAQKALVRKQKGSKNRIKARLRVARIHARIADRRRDHLHKVGTRLVRENQTIVVEDLAVRNTVKNSRLARAISDASWAELRTMLDHKARWYGRRLVAIDRWFPSSKTCSACGDLLDRLPLTIRTWACRCGTVHDRDINAARTVLAAGLAVTACGDGVRPTRHQSARQLSKPPSEGRNRNCRARARWGVPLLQQGEEVKRREYPSVSRACGCRSGSACRAADRRARGTRGARSACPASSRRR